MKNKFFFTFLATTLMTVSAWAIGPQSLKVTFDGTDNAGWAADVVSSNVSNGILSATQDLNGEKYRGDLKFNKANDGTNTFMLNPSKDKYLAIKFIGSRPGGKMKFEFQHDDQQWCNSKWNGGNPSSVDATDGKVYYFNLTDDDNYTSGHLDLDGNFKVRRMNFIIADNLDATSINYQVDWIATFESLEDIKMYAYWNDENTNLAYPLLEVGYRPKAEDGAKWESGTPKIGAIAANTSFEIKYSARLFSVEYFLIPDFAPNAIYTLSLHKSNQPAALGAWNFPYKNMPLSASESNVELRANVETVTGVAVGASDYSTQKPAMGAASCVNNVWSISIAGFQLTEIEKDAQGNSLVAMLVANSELGNTGQAHFYTYNAANDAANYPTLEKTGSYAVINITKMVGYANLKAAVDAAEHNDVLEIYENVELGARINTNDRALTIQGHTGTEVIARKSSYTNGLMFLTTDNTNAALTVRNLIVDGNNVATSSQVFESSNSTKMTTLENVTIQNVNVTNDLGSAITNKKGGALTLNNVTFQNCTCTGSTNNTPSVVFVGTNNVIFKGNNRFINCGDVPNVRIEKKCYMSADGELTHETPITIQLDQHVSGNSIIKGCADHTKFALVGTDMILENGANEVVVKDYALVNVTQDLGYNTFADAIAAAEDGDIIEIRKDITTPSGRTDIAKAITFKAVNGAVIYNGTSDNNMLFLSQSADGVTFEDIIIDGNSKNRNDIATMEAGSNKRLILKNVTIRNLTSGRDVTNNGYIELYGNNVLPNGIRLNMNRYVTDHETTHTTPIHFSLATDYIENADAVHGTTDYTRYSVSKDGVEWETYADTEHNQVRVRTIRVPLTYNLTVSAAGMATLVLGFDVPVLPAGVKAYTLTNNGSADIIATEETAIAANKPVLIIAEAGTYTFESEAGAVLNEQPNPTNGCLVGTYTDNTSIAVSASPNFNYILASGDAGVGFYQVTGAGYSIDKNRAYLSCGYNNAAAAAPMRIRFPQVPTQLDNAAIATPAEKLLIDGKLYIRKADRTYTIDGQLMK